MKISRIYKYIFSFCLTAVLLTAAGCNDGPEPTTDDTTAIYIQAEVSHNSQARSYIPEGTVEEGDYNLTFPSTVSGQYNIGLVSFGESPENPQIGIVKLAGGTPLKWLTVGGGATPTLYLDNIPRTETGASTSTTVTFSDSSNPYMAAPFDSIEGTNDLLWGAKMFQRNAGTLHFDLQHAMARVRLMVTADNTNGEIDLTGATVRITNLNLKPVSFDRIEGTLQLDTESADAYADLVFVDPENGGPDWLNSYESDGNKTVYQSPDFVLPPQDLLQDDNRPRLVIKLASGAEYSGILPSAMLIGDGVHAEPSYPVALSFLSQYVLTIRTVVTDEPPSLTFMPVYVMKWVDKGSFDEEAHQSGIYKAAEFYQLIEYYNRGKVFQLDRYGKQKETNGVETWHFDFWNSVTLDYNEIHGRMRENPTGGPFTFVFNNYTVSVQYGADDIRTVSPAQLYNIVTGQ